MAIMNIENKIVAFGDVAQTNNPRLRYVDWYRNVQGIGVNNPRSQSFVVGPGGQVTIAGQSIINTPNQITVAGTITKGTRTSLEINNGSNNGTPKAVIEELESISVQTTGFVVFKMPQTQNINTVSTGDIFYVKGICTQDGAGPFNQINEGLWKVISTVNSVSEKSMTCQKMTNGSSAVNQTFNAPLGQDYNLIVCNQPLVQQGEYIAIFDPGSSVYGYLHQVLYSDALRIDIPFLTYQPPFDTVYAVPEKYDFAYIETDGEALLSYEVGGTSFLLPIMPMQVAPDQKLGWAQVTSGFNYISITNNGSKNIRVNAVIGG